MTRNGPDIEGSLLLPPPVTMSKSTTKETKTSSSTIYNDLRICIRTILHAFFIAWAFLHRAPSLLRKVSWYEHASSNETDGRNLVPCTDEDMFPTLDPPDPESRPSPAPPPTPTEHTPLLTTNDYLDYASSSSSSDTTDSALSSPSCTTPSSPASSYASLRSALKSTSRPVSGPIAIRDSQPSTFILAPPPQRKSVRFTEADDLHLFEYGSWEQHEKKALRSVSGIGKWKKSGKTIIWQGEADGKVLRRSASSLEDDEDEDANRGGLYAWFLGSSRSSFFSSSSSSSFLAAPNAYSPPGRKYMTYGDETRWREAVF